MDNTAALFERIKARNNRNDDKPSPVLLVRWTKQTLVAAMGACGFTEGAELGVREGLGAEQLCMAMPGLHLLCVDPWDQWDGHKDMRGHYENPRLFLREAQERLKAYDCEFAIARSKDWADKVLNKSLDFVYVDGDHTFDGTLLDLILWAPKVKPGGILAGHEYKLWRYNGVIEAVNAYARAHNVRDWYITNEREATWFWRVK